MYLRCVTKTLNDMKKRIYTFAMCCIIGVALISNVQQVQAQTMTLSPHLIVLNAIGGPDVDAHYGGPLNGTIVDFDVKMFFDGVEVADAYAFTYCYVDNIFKGEFDRQSITFSKKGTFVANMSGWYKVQGADGNITTIYFDKWDWVEIKSPGKKGK